MTLNKSKRAPLLIAAIVLVLVAALLVAKHHHSNNTPVVTNSEHEGLEDGSLQTEKDLNNFKTEAVINITAEGSSPETLTVDKDTKITWENQDSSPHTLAISPGSAKPNQFYNNRKIDVGGGYPYVIHQTGTFSYYYADDPTHTGTIVVK